MVRVITIVLNWNRCADTLACLASVRAMTYSTEIVVIDNGSTDESVATIRAAYPDVTILETGMNLGYAAGNNVGFDYVRQQTNSDAILLLNNDTIAAPEMLTQLTAEYEAMEGKAVIGPEVRYADEPRIIWCAGGRIDWWRGYTTNIGIGMEAQEPAPPAADVPFVVGCAMLIPIVALQRIGGFDSRYFMYWEEVDWCIRAQKAGYRARVVPKAVLYHKVPRGDERPSPRVLYYLTRNRLVLLRTHLPWYRQPLALSWTLWGLMRTGLDLLQRRDWRREQALVRGILDAARGKTGISRVAW
ncbi:MAG TPA: glycosyltransferase family 2 protein [Thermomicrobiales bacterium]